MHIISRNFVSGGDIDTSVLSTESEPKLLLDSGVVGLARVARKILREGAPRPARSLNTLLRRGEGWGKSPAYVVVGETSKGDESRGASPCTKLGTVGVFDNVSKLIDLGFKRSRVRVSVRVRFQMKT